MEGEEPADRGIAEAEAPEEKLRLRKRLPRPRLRKLRLKRRLPRPRLKKLRPKRRLP